MFLLVSQYISYRGGSSRKARWTVLECKYKHNVKQATGGGIFNFDYAVWMQCENALMLNAQAVMHPNTLDAGKLWK